MLTKEQIAARKVGGSDVATILGLNPYKTAVELYHEARGTLPVADLSDNPNIAAGNLLEDGIADLAAFHMEKAWGRPVKLRRSNRTLVHPRYEWLTVHIDRDVVGEDRGGTLRQLRQRAITGDARALADDLRATSDARPHDRRRSGQQIERRGVAVDSHLASALRRAFASTSSSARWLPSGTASMNPRATSSSSTLFAVLMNSATCANE